MSSDHCLVTRFGLFSILFSMATTVAAESFLVNTSADNPDGDLGDLFCDTGNLQDGFTGLCSLRAALQNAGAGDDIGFDASIITISPLSELPPLSASISGGSGTSRVELDGSKISGLAAGLVVRSGALLIDSLIINRFPGIGLTINTGQGPGTLITNCVIGLDRTGLISPGFGNGGDGIFAQASDDLTIGGQSSVSANVISGNEGAGIRIFGRNFFAGPVKGTRIIGNMIGTDASGDLPLGNGSSGVILGQDNLAITETMLHGNVISGNGGHGVELRGKRSDVPVTTTDRNRITANKIGTNAAGLVAIPNSKSGIFLSRNDESFVGSIDDPAAGSNLISGNLEHGIAFTNSLSDTLTVVGNIIGADINGNGPLGNGGYGIGIFGGIIGLIGGGGQSPPDPLMAPVPLTPPVSAGKSDSV